MHKRNHGTSRVHLALAVMLFVAMTKAAHSQVPCDGVAGNVFRTEHIKTTDYSRLVLAAHLSKMTYQEAMQHLEGGVTIPIYGVPVNANMSKDDFTSFQETVRQTLDVDQVLQHQTEILVSEGDSNILNAWSGCIQNFYGITAILKDLGTQTLRLTLHYAPPPMSTAAPIVQGYTLTGGTVIGGQTILAKDSREIGIMATRFVSIKRDGNQPVYFVLNTENVGDVSAFLPPRYTKPPVKRLTWSGGTSQHTIEEELPAEATGKSVRINIEGHAFSAGIGAIWGTVWVNGAQKCASDKVSGRQDITLKMPCHLPADNTPNQKIKIFINNENADARSVKAEVLY